MNKDQVHLSAKRLIEAHGIGSMELFDLNENGEVDNPSRFRNTQTLIINFPSGQSLEISSFCSGSSEDTTLWLTPLEGNHVSNSIQ